MNINMEKYQLNEKNFMYAIFSNKNSELLYKLVIDI